MKVVYIAGKFRGPNHWEIAENIRRAERLGLAVASLGAVPLIPHANTAHFHGTLTDEFWLEATRELLRRSDAVILEPSWRGSTGTLGEIDEAKARDMPIFETLDALEDWLRVVYTQG